MSSSASTLRVLYEIVAGAAGVAAIFTLIAISIHTSGIRTVFDASTAQPFMLVAEIWVGFVVIWALATFFGTVTQILSYRLGTPPVVGPDE